MSEAPKKVAKTVTKSVGKTVKKGTAAKTDAGLGQELKLKLSKFSPVYLLAWQGENSTCSICRYDFVDGCPNCQLEREGDINCPVQTGTCGHKFHMHCLQGWLSKGHDTCPLCTAKWEIANE